MPPCELGRASRSSKRSPPAPRGASPRPAAARTAAATCPSEIAFLSRAAALLAATTARAPSCCRRWPSALFEAGSLDRAAAVADEALAVGERLGLPRVRWRAAVERERMQRLPPSRHGGPGRVAGGRPARRHRAARALGDDLGLARALLPACELVWLKGSFGDAAIRNAERMLHHARRARSGFEIEAAVSYMAWALVVNAVPVSDGEPRAARSSSARSPVASPS